MEAKNSKGRIVLLSVLVAAMISSCCQKTTNAARDYISEGFFLAKVIKPEIAGCDYVLMIASVSYQPLNLKEEFKKDGTELWVKYHREKSHVSNCMMGEIITIDEIHLKLN